MKKPDFNQWLQILSNLAVVLGIIFLAVEIRQNSSQLQNQSYQSWVSAVMAMNMTAADPAVSEILANGHADPRLLTRETFISYALYNMSVLQMAQSIDYLYRNGSIDEELWEAEINRAAGILASPGVRQWWDAGGRSQLAPAFAELIESKQTSMTIWCWRENEGFVTAGDDYVC